MTTEDIIIEKDWSQLSDSDREAVAELATDEQTFNNLKGFYKQLSALGPADMFEPSVRTKTRLDEVFARQHPVGRVQTESVVKKLPVEKAIPLHQRNWSRIAAAAIFVGIALMVWTWPESQSFTGEKKIAKSNEPVEFTELDLDAQTETQPAPAVAPERASAEPEMITENEVSDELAESAVSVNDAAVEKDAVMSPEPAHRSRFTNAGRLADLTPNSSGNYSLAATSEDYLAFIKPAF